MAHPFDLKQRELLAIVALANEPKNWKAMMAERRGARKGVLYVYNYMCGH